MWNKQIHQGRGRQERLSSRGRRLFFALAVAILGIMNGLTALLPVSTGRRVLLSSLLEALAPFTPSLWPVLQIGRTMALLLGFFLLVVAVGLLRGKRRAWQSAMVLLPLSALAHLLKGLDVEAAILTLGLWLALLYSDASFQVASDPGRLRQGVLLLLLGFLFFLLYSFSGVSLLQNQLVLPGTFLGLLRSLLLRSLHIPESALTPLTAHASWFLDSLPVLGAAALLTGMIFLLRPVSARWWRRYQQEHLAQIRDHISTLVCRYGSQTLSFFTLAPENLYYLSTSGDGVVAYRLTGNVAVVLGDPICPPQACERVTREFLALCARNDWLVTIYQAHPENLEAYRRCGLHTFKIGEEALLDPRTFTLSGSAMANVRTSSRRAQREGVQVQWYEGVPPEKVLYQLQHLSQRWLERKGGTDATEMGFSMGRLEMLRETAERADMLAQALLREEKLSQQKVPCLLTGVATTSSGQPCAFVTFTPIYGPASFWGWALDLMRRTPDAPPGTVELLLIQAMERFREWGRASSAWDWWRWPIPERR